MPWAPEDIVSVAAAWVADDIAQGDGTAVASWTDRHAALAASQATGGKQPLYRTAGVAGLPAVDFDGSNDLLRYAAANAVTAALSGHVFVVTELDAVGSLMALWATNDEGSNLYALNGLIEASAEVEVQQANNDTADIVVTGRTLSTATPYLVEYASDGDAYTLRINAVTQELSTSGGSDLGDWFGDTPNRDNFTIGASKITSEQTFLNGKVAVVIVVAGPISDADRALLYSWVESTYGIVVTPPANDNLAAAEDLGSALSGSSMGNNERATTETGEVIPSVGGGDGPWHTQWYKWLSPAARGVIEFDTFNTIWDGGSNADTVLAAYTSDVPSPAFTDLVEVAANDDDSDSPGGNQSKIAFVYEPSTLYFVQFCGYGPDLSYTGPTELDWAPVVTIVPEHIRFHDMLLGPTPVLRLGGVPRSAHGAGFTFVRDTPEPLVVELIDALSSPLSGADWALAESDLPTAKEHHFGDPFGGDGDAKVSVKNGSADRTAVAIGKALRFKVDGVNAFLALINHLGQATLAVDPAGERTAVECGGYVTILSQIKAYPNRWISAGPDPRPKEQSRTFSFATDPFDDTAWPHAVVLARSSDTTPGWTSTPPAWPDDAAGWVVPAGHGCTLTSCPPGRNFYDRMSFWRFGGGRKTSRLYWAGDDAADGFFDGLVLGQASFGQLTSVDFELSEGGHTLAFTVQNTAATGLPINPTGLKWALFETSNNLPVGVLFGYPVIGYDGLDPILGASPVPLHSSGFDRAIMPTAPPGITIGLILSQLFLEMRARGFLGVDWDFDGDVDSLGHPWPIIPGYTVQHGQSYLEILHAMFDGGYLYFRMDPFRPLLHAYVPGLYGSTATDTFGFTTDRATATLAELTHDEYDISANVMLVEFKNGVIEVAHPDYVEGVNRRVEGYLPLDVETEDQARDLGLQIVLRSALPQLGVGAKWKPRDARHTPYRNPTLTPGNRVPISNATKDGLETKRISGFTVDLDENRQRTIVPELEELNKEGDELVQAILRRQNPGIGSLYPVTGPVIPPTLPATNPKTPAFAFTLGSIADTIVNTDVPMPCQLREAVFTRWDDGNVPYTGFVNSTAFLYVNGVAVATLEIDPGQATGRVNLMDVYPGILRPGVDRIAVKYDAGPDNILHSVLVQVEAAS